MHKRNVIVNIVGYTTGYTLPCVFTNFSSSGVRNFDFFSFKDGTGKCFPMIKDLSGSEIQIFNAGWLKITEELV